MRPVSYLIMMRMIEYKFPNLSDCTSPADGAASFLGRQRGRLGLRGGRTKYSASLL